MILVKQLGLLYLLFTNGTNAFAQPPGKHWEGVAYNERTKELAVFSGTESRDNKWIVTDSLWLFNGKWRFVDKNDIPGRWAHAFTYHKGDLYSYGGLVYNAQQQEQVVNDLFRFKDSWRKVANGPTLSMPVLFSSEEKLLLAGQPDEDRKSFEVWELKNDSFQKQSSVSLGLERDGLHTLLVKNDLVVVYPSDSGFVFQNITSGHSSLVTDLPKRTKFGITYNTELDSYFLFGGLDEKRNFTNELWIIQNGSSKKLMGEYFPAPRASCRLLPTTKGFILYGGVENGGKLSNAAWRYENGKWIRIEY